MDQIRADLRAAVRGLVKHPGASLLIILTLAIGISVNAVVFSLINGLLFKPNPYADANLTGIHAVGPGAGDGELTLNEVAAIGRASTSWDALTAEGRLGLALDTPRGAEQVWALAVSDNYFSMVGAQTIRGRSFTDADAGRPSVVITQALWRQQFGDDDSLAGRTITLNKQLFAVTGVVRDGFRGFSGIYTPDVVVPLSALDLLGLQSLKAPHRRWLYAAGRLAPGRDHPQAIAELTALSPHIVRETAPPGGSETAATTGTSGSRHFNAVSTRDGNPERRAMRPFGVIALAAVSLVLVLACFNVTGLLLARATERQREMGVRAALGASHARLMRQLLTESLLLAAIAGLAALIVANWSHALLAVFRLPAPVPQDIDMSPDWRLLLYSIALAAAAGILPGLAPALHVRRLDILRVLKDDDRGSSSPRPKGRRALLLIEIAGSTFILTVAFLLLQSFRHVSTLDFGFETTRALVLSLGSAGRGDSAAQSGAAQSGAAQSATGPGTRRATEILERLRALPGVTTAGFTTRPPGGIGYLDYAKVSTDTGDCQRDDCPRVSVIRIGPGYFDALRIPIVAGGGFEPDATPRRDAMVIDEKLARQLFPARSPIGAWIRVGDDRALFQVTGVAREANHIPPGEDRVMEVYRALRDDEIRAGGSVPAVPIVIGTRGDPAAVAASVREAVRAFDPDLPIARLQTMTGHLELARWGPRTLAAFSMICAAVAVTLATVGLFSLTQRSVSQRLREFGVRSALGASPRQLLSLVLREGATITLGGLLVGIGAAALASSLIRRLLFQVSATDPAVYASVALAMGLVALAACATPALRAARVDPLEVLRDN